jgi:hypothetical protein
VVSDPEVNRRLREFVCVRMDWEQMQRHKSRWPTPEQGNQVLLTPQGDPLHGTPPRGKRYPIPELVARLDAALEQHPPRHDRLDLDWFFWNPEQQGYPPVFGAEFISRLDRKPLLEVSGPVPGWFRNEPFLRSHLRQFVWTRGSREGPPRFTIRQLEPEPRELLSLTLSDQPRRQLTEALDEAWLRYMRSRPLVARGYIDNPHGAWLRPVMERAHQEEVELQRLALQGKLTPPGRPLAPRVGD